MYPAKNFYMSHFFCHKCGKFLKSIPNVQPVGITISCDNGVIIPKQLWCAVCVEKLEKE